MRELFIAIDRQQVNTVKQIIQQHKDYIINVDPQDTYGKDLLQCAILSNNVDIFEAIFNIYNTSERYETALKYAIEYEKYEIIKYLLKNTQNLISNYDYITSAIEKNCPIGIINYLIEKGADTKNISYEELEKTHLIKMCIAENIAEIKILLENNNYCKDYITKALIYAVKNNKLESTKCLVANGANTKIKNENNKSILLLSAIDNDNDDMLDYLIEYRADDKLQEYISYAVKNNKTKSVKCLVENVADPNIEITPSYTLLEYFLGINNIDMVNYLLTKRADTKNISYIKLEQTHLIKMCIAENIAEIKILLENNNYCPDYLTKVLQCAIEHNNLDAVKCLVKTYVNANTKIKIKENRTIRQSHRVYHPDDPSEINVSIEYVEVLEEREISIIDYAEKLHNTQIVDYLKSNL